MLRFLIAGLVRFSSIAAFLGYLGVCMLPGCCRYSGPFIRSHEEATAVVGTYRPGILTESRFLEEWPLLENQPGEKYEWVWGIMQTSSQRTDYNVTRSYWLGNFGSSAIIRRRGYHFRSCTGHRVWRLDFRDSVLVSVTEVDTP
jgi:hypothetical protein